LLLSSSVALAPTELLWVALLFFLFFIQHLRIVLLISTARISTIKNKTMIPNKFGLYIMLICLLSCNSPKPEVIQSKNDTAKVLELAIRTAFYHEQLPEISPLKKEFHFNDSILFTTGSLPLTALPSSIDSINFKILSRNQICSIIKADSNISEPPNYLYINTFEKSDTGYYVSIQSLSCLPYGGGGSIGIYISKDKDSFFVKKRMSSSIN
jgi:hypothetical protein